ncbi:MAG: hypothetical protein CMO44_17920 [Verrucomicrobiales bacterium]|nr:hypothetical protein [Verrucomicrobiales bacterium]
MLHDHVLPMCGSLDKFQPWHKKEIYVVYSALCSILVIMGCKISIKLTEHLSPKPKKKRSDSSTSPMPSPVSSTKDFSDGTVSIDLDSPDSEYI